MAKQIEEAYNKIENAMRSGVRVEDPIIEIEDRTKLKEHVETTDKQKPKHVHKTKATRYTTLDEEYTDKALLTSEAQEAFFTLFNKNLLTPQYGPNGQIYFNPKGLITLGDLLNTLADPTVTNIQLSEDGVTDSLDFYNNGYNQMLELTPELVGVITRSEFYLPVSKKVLKFVLSAFTIFKDIEEDGKMVTRKELAQLHQELSE